MDKLFTDKDLCAALSDIFVDNETDYEKIASVARYFPAEHVRLMLFRYVAPACYTNTLSPVPAVWLCFDDDALWEEIHSLKMKERTLCGKLRRDICMFYFRRRLQEEWRTLERYLQE